MEAEAVKTIMLRIGRRTWTGVHSEVMDFEIGKMVDLERQLNIALMLDAMALKVVADESEKARAVALQRIGFKPVDAAHIACAERARADVFLTTDDALLKNATKHSGGLRVNVANPLSWLREVLEA